jgi:NADP-dependent 3-hydroxy acid dehydrogenase YdfG
MDGRPVADYQGKRIVVTGASSGIGEAIALELSRRGARPVLVGRNIEKLRAAASQLGLPDDFVLPLDLKDHSTILPGIMLLSQKIGSIYGLCHAAGTADTVPLSSCTVDKIQAMLDVNLLAGIEMARAVCRRDIMEKDGVRFSLYHPSTDKAAWRRDRLQRKQGGSHGCGACHGH